MARKHWIYTNSNFETVGLMVCISCNKGINGDYRFYETEEAYRPQCFECGKSDPRWIEKLKQDNANSAVNVLRKKLANPSFLTADNVAAEIKQAFMEGYGSYSTPAAAYNSVEEAWEESESKVVYDILLGPGS